MSPHRRDVLEFAATTLAMATMATAGVTGTTVDARAEANDELPAYSDWLTIDDDGLEFTFVDWTALEGYVEDELEGVGADEGADIPEAYEDDPMIVLPSDGLLSAYLFVGLGLVQYRLARLLEDDAFDSSVDGLLQIGEAFVVTGTIEPEEIDDQLTAEPEAGFIRRMEQTDEIGEYAVYTPVDDDDETAIAVGSEALVIVDAEEAQAGGADPSTVLETTIGAAEGDVERAIDDSETLEWLLETAGNGDVVVGLYGDSIDVDDYETLEALADADGLVSSLTVEDEQTSTGDFAAVIDDPDEDVLESVLGASADEQSVDVDGDRVTATATWREPN